jgi:uncharacterized protein
MSLLEYKVGEGIGKVDSVDTASVVVKVTDESRLRGLQVNHLVAIRSSRAGQHLIGMISKIMRKAMSSLPDNEGTEEIPEGAVIVENLVRILLIGTLVDRVGTEPNIFRRTLETVPEIDAECFVIEGEHLTGFMQAISKSSKDGIRPLSLGYYTIDDAAEAWIDGNRFFQRHAVIVGSTGTGKSWTVARIIEQVAALPNANAILFDIHGEYSPIAGSGIQHLKIAGPGDLTGKKGLNDGIIFLPYWLLTYEEMLAMLLDRSDQNAPNQAMVFSREVTQAKQRQLEKENRKEVLANFTIDSPIPYILQDVITQLVALDVEKVEGARAGTEKVGPFNGKLTRFIQRLEAKRGDRRLGFLFGAPEETMSYDWFPKLCKQLLGGSRQQETGGVKIIDFSEVPSDVMPLMLGLVARLIFSVQQWVDKKELHPIAIFCDEAHLYIPERLSTDAATELGFRSFERVAKEGRKYGIGLIVISQRPSEVNKTVLSQCNNFVAMRLSNAEDQAAIRRLLPDSLGGIADVLPVLDTGEALVVGDASLLPSRIRITPPTKKPNSGTISFWDEWGTSDDSEGIATAVEALRRQTKS